MKTSETVSVVRERVVCDGCGARGRRQCCGCGKDLCQKCIVFWEYDPFTGCDNGDYSQVVCAECDERAKPLAAKARAARDECDAVVEELERQWKAR